MQDRPSPLRFLIHDQDTKFTPAFDAVVASDGIAIVLTPPQAPNANAFAECWVCTVREECLDHLLIFGDRHFRRVLKEYIVYYNCGGLIKGFSNKRLFRWSLAGQRG